VLFVNQSIARSHNLYGLHEIWQNLRQKAGNNQYFKDFSYLDYTNPVSLDEARSMRSGLLERRSEIEAWLGNRRLVSELGYVLNNSQYNMHREVLDAEIEYISACTRVLKDYISAAESAMDQA